MFYARTRFLRELDPPDNLRIRDVQGVGIRIVVPTFERKIARSIRCNDAAQSRLSKPQTFKHACPLALVASAASVSMPLSQREQSKANYAQLFHNSAACRLSPPGAGFIFFIVCTRSGLHTPTNPVRILCKIA
jgi:hypothetical protein